MTYFPSTYQQWKLFLSGKIVVRFWIKPKYSRSKSNLEKKKKMRRKGKNNHGEGEIEAGTVWKREKLRISHEKDTVWSAFSPRKHIMQKAVERIAVGSWLETFLQPGSKLRELWEAAKSFLGPGELRRSL